MKTAADAERLAQSMVRAGQLAGFEPRRC